MPWRKTHHPANPLLGARHQQAPVIYVEGRRIGQKRREVIVEHECARVLRITCAVRPFISRAQVASGIVSRQVRRRRLLHSPMQRPLRPMGQNQYPVTRQSLEPTEWHLLYNPSITAFPEPRRAT